MYLTVNTLFKERELTEELYSYLLPYYEQGLDAVIIQDMGAFRLVREAFPGLSIHTSTQMTVTNRYGAMMMKELGADRVVTAREMSLRRYGISKIMWILRSKVLSTGRSVTVIPGSACLAVC